MIRSPLIIAALALGLLVPAAAIDSSTAEAKTQRSSRQGQSSDGASQKKAGHGKGGKVKVCTTKGQSGKSKRSCHFEASFQGHSVGRSSLRAEPLERPSGDIWVVSNNVRDEVKVNIYAADGGFDEAALARLDEIFRCRRSNEVRAVDPHLYEMLSRVFDHFGQHRIELVSGFRFLERDSSRHFHASAMDVRIEGVSVKEIYAYAESQDLGNMGIGIYPNSGFVHVDFRAPGEPSYRWTDRSGNDSAPKRGAGQRHRPDRTVHAKKPTS